MLHIRSFRSEDIDPLYAISLATGFAGRDASHQRLAVELMGSLAKHQGLATPRVTGRKRRTR
jgi:hypothetical protein